MGKPQVTLTDLDGTTNPVLLDNTGAAGGDWRRIVGDISDDTGIDGARSVSVSFVIEADSADALQTRYATTRSELITRNRRARITLDDASGSYFADIYTGDGKHLGVTTTIVDADDDKTVYALPLVFVLMTEATSIPASGFGSLTTGPDAGIESLALVVDSGAGRDTVRRVTGSVVNNGTAASTLYSAARAGIIVDLLLAASDGSRDPTNKHVLVGEEVTNIDEDERVDFELTSEYSPFVFSSLTAARGASLEISSTQVDEWDTAGGGPAPLLIHVTGAIFISKDVWTAGMLTAWASARSDIESIIATETGESSPKLVKHQVRADPNDQTLVIDAIWQTRQGIHVQWNRQEKVIDEIERVVVVDSDGYQAIQESPAGSNVIRVVSVTREGVGLLTEAEMLDPPPVATMEGRQLYRISGEHDFAGPMSKDFGVVYRQAIVVRYQELRVRDQLPVPQEAVPLGG
jgi:hypothetical protein